MSSHIEYLTGNRRIRYPFADDSVIYADGGSSSSSELDQIPDSLAISVFGCFVDAMIQLKPGYENVVPTIDGISIYNHTLSFTLSGGSCGVTPLTCTLSRETFPIISSENQWCWYVFVLSSSGIKEYDDNSSSIGPITATSLAFNSRCIGLSNLGVSSISIYGGEGIDQSTGNRYTLDEAMQHPADCTISDELLFIPGNNMTFGQGENGFSLNAVPGAGDGRVPCDCEEVQEYKTPGLISSDGHVRLFNDTCYDLMPYKVADDCGILKVSAKCKACCTCEMYESIVKDRLIPLRDKVVDSKGTLDDVLSTYEDNVAKWNDRIAKALPEDIVITSTCVSLDAAATDINTDAEVTGKMDRCGYSINIRNDSFVTVTIEMDSFHSNGKAYEAQVGYMDENKEPIIVQVDLSGEGSSSGPLFSIELAPGRTATLTFFVRLGNLVRTDHRSGFLAYTKISAYQNGSLIVTRRKELGL